MSTKKTMVKLEIVPYLALFDLNKEWLDLKVKRQDIWKSIRDQRRDMYNTTLEINKIEEKLSQAIQKLEKKQWNCLTNSKFSFGNLTKARTAPSAAESLFRTSKSVIIAQESSAGSTSNETNYHKSTNCINYIYCSNVCHFVCCIQYIDQGLKWQSQPKSQSRFFEEIAKFLHYHLFLLGWVFICCSIEKYIYTNHLLTKYI